MHSPDDCGEAQDGSAAHQLHIRITTKGRVDKYPAKSHARRVAGQLKAHHGLIILQANKAKNWPNSDMPAPWRQDRYFYYLSGCNEPDCYISYDLKRDLLTLWLPPISKERVVWYGRGSTVEEALEKYDIDAAQYINPSNLPETASIFQRFSHAIPETTSPVLTCCLRLWKHGPIMAAWMEGGLAPVYCLDDPHTSDQQSLRRAIDACRVIKDDHEIELIRRANLITAAAHVNVLKGMHAFESESEVEAAYMQVCIARKAKEQAYDPIAGSGSNAAELHYSNNTADFGNGQTVVLDAGCEVERYASDVTRTFPINRSKPGHWPSQETEGIYKLVENIQESCIKRMLPGARFIETFWHAHEMVLEGLLSLGILKGGTVEEIFTTGTSRAFLPHGLGHHVGLEVHDASPVPHPPLLNDTSCTGKETDSAIESLREAFADWKPVWAARTNMLKTPQHFALDSTGAQYLDAPVLEPGMVVTVEPGIYFNKYLLDNFFLNDPRHSKFIDRAVLGRYMQVGGVRIEDDILITKHGYENLTTAPKGEEMLKIIRHAARAKGLGLDSDCVFQC